MADRPATPTLSRILSDPQTCPDFSKKSHATFPSPVSKNFSSNHLILSSPFPPLLISTNSIDSRLREKKKKKTPVRDFPTTAYRLNPSISRIGLIPAPNFCNSRGRKKGGIEREGVGCSEQEALGTRRKHPWLNDSGGRKRIEAE